MQVYLSLEYLKWNEPMERFAPYLSVAQHCGCEGTPAILCRHAEMHYRDSYESKHVQPLKLRQLIDDSCLVG